MRTYLHSLSATAGFLEHCQLEFAPGLNCIIGARGTCKSTLLESIRFVYEADSARVQSLLGEQDNRIYPHYGMIKHTLGAGSIHCETIVEHEVGTTHQVLEREIGGQTRLFQDGVREHAQQDVLHEIEIFSQGELQRIADDGNDELRLTLIDRPNASKIAKLQGYRQQATQELLKIGPELRSLRTRIQTLRQELQPKNVLKERLQQVVQNSPELTPELERERLLYECRRRTVEQLNEIAELCASVLDQLSSIQETSARIDTIANSVRRQKDIEFGAALISLDAIEQALAGILMGGKALSDADLSRVVEGLRADFEDQNETFYRLRQEQQAVNEALKQQQHLQRQLESLEKREKELELALAKEVKLIEKRLRARAQIAAIDDEVFSLRIAQIDAINEQHGDTVHLALQSGSGAPRYVTRLSNLLGGSRIRSQEDVAAALADIFSPASLIDVVESGNGQRLADVLDRDLGQMNRVVAHLGDHPELYTLEAEPPAVRLDITLFDNDEPKTVETLSKGQKATALLPLILRPLPYPLLFDQPEDDLDNHFIFSSLINTVQRLKFQRQVIFVTHNANIPVLGEADRVIVMSMKTPVQAATPQCGTVDECKQEILDLLEGGVEAFRRREASYHEILNR